MIYLIGSLRNPDIPGVAGRLRAEGYEVFDDWHAAGPEADDEWKRYEQERGRGYKQALAGWAAEHVFDFDYKHLNRAKSAVLVLPAGKSAHLELGYMIGKGKPGYVLMDNPDRWDVMYQFARAVCFSLEELVEEIGRYDRPNVVKGLTVTSGSHTEWINQHGSRVWFSEGYDPNTVDDVKWWVVK